MALTDRGEHKSVVMEDSSVAMDGDVADRVTGRFHSLHVALALAVCVLTAAPAFAQTLPRDVEIDILTIRLTSAVESGNGPEAIQALDSLRLLDPGAVSGAMLLTEAQAFVLVDELDQAKASLTRFLSGADRSSSDYKDAIGLFVKVTDLITERNQGWIEQVGVYEKDLDFDAAEALLRKLMLVLSLDDPLYAKSVVMLSGLPQRRAAAEEAKAAEAEEEKARAARVEAWNIGEANGKEAERLLYLSPEFSAEKLEHLRWVLNSRHGTQRLAQPAPGQFLSDAERESLEKYRKTQGLYESVHPAAASYLDMTVFAALVGQEFYPAVVSPYTLPDDLITIEDWNVFIESPYEDPSRVNCMAYTHAVSTAPLPEYLLPLIGFGASSDYATGEISVRFPGSVAGESITFDVDGRTYAVANKDGRLSVQGDPSPLRAMRRGQTLSITYMSNATKRTVVAKFSLKGFTQAFQKASELCDLPDILVWIR